jgi:hypothetical protein
MTKSLARPPGMTAEECGSLPVYDAGDGKIISCWRMGWRERIAALVSGTVWLWVYSGTHTQPPVSLRAARTIFEHQEQQPGEQ